MKPMQDFRFHHNVDEICALLGYYVMYIGNSLPKFQVNLMVPSTRVKKSKNFMILEDGSDKLAWNAGMELPLYAV